MQVRVSKGADYRYIPRQRFAALPWNQCESVRPFAVDNIITIIVNVRTVRMLQMLREGNKFVLAIREVLIEDSGIFTCRASNPSGAAECSAELFVEGIQSVATSSVYLRLFPRDAMLPHSAVFICIGALGTPPSRTGPLATVECTVSQTRVAVQHSSDIATQDSSTATYVAHSDTLSFHTALPPGRLVT